VQWCNAIGDSVYDRIILMDTGQLDTQQRAVDWKITLGVLLTRIPPKHVPHARFKTKSVLYKIKVSGIFQIHEEET